MAAPFKSPLFLDWWVFDHSDRHEGQNKGHREEKVTSTFIHIFAPFNDFQVFFCTFKVFTVLKAIVVLVIQFDVL